jgi:hydroxyacylglutathione hydrolase
MITVHAVRALKDNYVWTLVDASKNAVIVDPGEAKPVIEFVTQQGLTPRAILLTHHHGDHTAGAAELKQKYKIESFGPGLKTGDKIKVDNFPLTFTAIPIPGHTLDHTAYYTDDGCVFSGDMLFSVGCGRVFEGTMEQMVGSLQKLAALPDDTKIYCGHEYTENNLRFAQSVEPNNSEITNMMERVKQLRSNNKPTLPSTMKQEKMVNPFLRCDIPEVKAAAENFSGRALQTPVEVFTALRNWKDDF